MPAASRILSRGYRLEDVAAEAASARESNIEVDEADDEGHEGKPHEEREAEIQGERHVDQIPCCAEKAARPIHSLHGKSGFSHLGEKLLTGEAQTDMAPLMVPAVESPDLRRVLKDQGAAVDEKRLKLGEGSVVVGHVLQHIDAIDPVEASPEGQCLEVSGQEVDVGQPEPPAEGFAAGHHGGVPLEADDPGAAARPGKPEGKAARVGAYLEDPEAASADLGFGRADEPEGAQKATGMGLAEQAVPKACPGLQAGV